MKNYFILLSLLISFSLELEESSDKKIEISEYFDKIQSIEISNEVSKKLIDLLLKILERYVYLDILKYPPQPKDNENYYNTVDLIKELKSVNTNGRFFYDFYREVRTIIDSCQDRHLQLSLNEKFNYSIFMDYYIKFPLYLYIKKDGIYSVIDNTYSESTSIKSINNLDPFDYIQKFNGKFNQYKSHQAQFIYNLLILNNGFSIIDLPLDYESLTNIKVIYNNGTEISIDFIIYYKNNYYLQGNIKSIENNNNYLDKYLNSGQIINDNIQFNLKWKFINNEKEKIKCTVDEVNEVNVIYQHSFDVSNLDDTKYLLDNCFNDFDKNKYPLIIIEELNTGGSLDLADYLISYINLNKSSVIYSSYRYNDEVKNNIANRIDTKDIEECKIELSDYFFNFTKKEDFYGISSNGEKIIHLRTKIFDSSKVEEKDFYNFRKKAKFIRKPHEIIIFTDGFSFSATSTFIKETQLKGGAIIVGYDGNPKLNIFDSSQSPTTVITTKELSKKNDNLSREIEDLGFSLTYSIIEKFSKPDYGNEKNIPLEYTINNIDERVHIYNGYQLSKYNEFINEAKRIFKKYKTECNKNNKKLLFITDECSDGLKHGGFECGNDGKWSKNCVYSYCDNGYIFDERNNFCKKDECIKEEKEYNMDKKHNLNQKEDINITTMSISLFGFLQIFFLIYMFKGTSKQKRKNFIAIIAIIDILFVFLFY